MIRYEHKKLLDALVRLDSEPDGDEEFAEWIRAEGHLAFLRENADSDHLVMFGSGGHSFIHSVAVPNEHLEPLEKEDLLGWSSNPFTSAASYVTGGGREDLWVERGGGSAGTSSLRDVVPLIFGRTFEGWAGPDRSYYELNQEFAHLADVHWRPEARAYCRFDQNGDLEPVASVTVRGDGNDAALVSVLWEPLEVYLAATDMSLMRMFDFTLLRPGSFGGWSREEPDVHLDDDSLFYRRLVMERHAAYTRGVQLVKPSRPSAEIFTRVTDGWFGRAPRHHVEFVAHDWRNNQVRPISTDPSATTNYFQAEGNDLPFELSPAFFRPEVLSKYKTDRDKYTLGLREVSCRAGWHLKGIDVNEAGQVHAYICDLRHLPYAEQLHWLSFNEPPKATISERAATNDFRGQWVAEPDPVTRLLSIVRGWAQEPVTWWSLRDPRLLEQVNTPLTASRDEWAEAFMDVAKLVVEGFEVKMVRSRLDDLDVPYGKNAGSIALLEKLLHAAGSLEVSARLEGLRTVQLVRSKVKGHASGSDADQISQGALVEHETFAAHFHFVCGLLAEELEMIGSAL